jgi:hypothetical protein
MINDRVVVVTGHLSDLLRYSAGTTVLSPQLAVPWKAFEVQLAAILVIHGIFATLQISSIFY